MTRYTVVWTSVAQDLLAVLWLEALDREALTVASRLIDQSLSEDALTKGVEIKEELRALTVSPITAIYHVRDEDRIVEVAYLRRS